MKVAAARRASAAEFTATYQGSHLSKRQYRALLSNPSLRVFDHDDAPLACDHNPLTAFCDPNRGTPARSTGTSSFDRCNTACVNVARTDTHIDRARREVTYLQDEIDSGLNPHPIEQRHQQRRLFSSRSSISMNAADPFSTSRRRHLSERPRPADWFRCPDRHHHRPAARPSSRGGR